MSGKSGRVCSVLEGVDMTRLIFSNTRLFFAGSIEDIELIRECVSESMTNGEIVGGLHDLDEMAATFDHQARGIPQETTTLDAELGWVDDREDRRMDRYVSQSENEPLVSTKQDDMAAIDAVSNIFPWIVDRRLVETLMWKMEDPKDRPKRHFALNNFTWLPSWERLAKPGVTLHVYMCLVTRWALGMY